MLKLRRQWTLAKGFQPVSWAIRLPTSPVVRIVIRNSFNALAQDPDAAKNDKEENEGEKDAGARYSSSPNG